MKLALIVPGFSAAEADWCIPALLNFVHALARQVELEVFALRYPHHRDSYRIGNAVVHSLGWAQRRGPDSPRLWLAAIQAIETRHRQAPFDCLHAFWADEPGWIGAVCAQRLGLPLVVSLAGGELIGLPGINYGLQRHRVQGRLVPWALGRASLVTAGSCYLFDLARPHVHDPQRLVLAPLGVDCTRFTPTVTAAIDDAEASGSASESLVPTPLAYFGTTYESSMSTPRAHDGAALESSTSMPETHVAPAPSQLINVGSLSAVKGHALLLRAMRRVAAALPAACLRIVGAGPLEGALQRQITELGLTERVTLAGAIAHEQLPGIYRTADLFVQTSLHEAEGMAVLEAAACGVPAVGTKVGVLPELAERGAAVTTAADERALADAVLALLRDPVRRAGLAHAARAAVLDAYSVDACVSRFLEGYASCLVHRLRS